MARQNNLTPTMKDALRTIRNMHRGRGYRGATFEDLSLLGIKRSTRRALERRGLVEFRESAHGCVGVTSYFRATADGRKLADQLQAETVAEFGNVHEVAAA